MAKFLAKATYGPDALKGLMKEGATARRATVQRLVEGLGGKLEGFYYAHGETDVYVIMDFPDPSAGLALSLAVNASGAVRLTTVPLITPEEMDAACKRSVPYQPPRA